jgi:hypothetical protein
MKNVFNDLHHIRERWDAKLSECKIVARAINIEQSFPAMRQKKRKAFFDVPDEGI